MYREYFKIDNNILYFNSASSGILTKNAAEKAREYINIALTKADVSVEEYFETLKNTRENIAQLLNTNSENIGFLRNTTDGVYVIKNSFQDYRNIIIYGKSFPCTEIPFVYDKRYKLDVISKDMNLLENALKSFGKSILFIDYVNYLTGEMVDLHSIIKVARKYDCIIAIDAIQALGSIPVNIGELDIDFLFAGTSKWLLGPQGSGLIYINEKHFQRIVNKCSGWLSLDFSEFGNFTNLPEPRHNASAVESGTRNYLGILIMNENIKIINEIGIENIYKYNMKNIKSLLEQLEIMGSVSQGINKVNTPIVALKCRNVKLLYSFLIEKKVTVSYRDGFIRFSPHLYNTEKEIDKLKNILKSYKI